MDARPNLILTPKIYVKTLSSNYGLEKRLKVKRIDIFMFMVLF